MRSLVRIFTMATAGAALLAGTAFTFEAPRRAVAEPEPTLARLSASAIRTIARSVFPREARHATPSSRIACGRSHHGDA